MSSKVPWVIAGVLAAACAFLSFTELKQVAPPPPKVITNEVVREVPKEIVKETVREVPKEVIREVVKEVPAEIPEHYKTAVQIASSLANAEFVAGDKTLAGIPSLKVRVALAEALNGKISESDLKDSIELGLRKNGIAIKNDQARHELWFVVDGLWDDRKVTFSYNARLSVTTSVYFFGEGKTKTTSAEIWVNGYNGYAGSSKIAEGIREAADRVIVTFSNRYLAENSR